MGVMRFEVDLKANGRASTNTYKKKECQLQGYYRDSCFYQLIARQIWGGARIEENNQLLRGGRGGPAVLNRVQH